MVPEVPQGKAIVIATKSFSIYFVIRITFFLRQLSHDECICLHVQFFALALAMQVGAELSLLIVQEYD